MSKGLGKGLEGLFEENTAFENDPKNGKRLSFIKIVNIEPNKEQPRKIFDKEAIDELSSSIARHGVLQPIIVRPQNNGQFQIISGERRWRAARLAGLTEMPVLVKEDTDDVLALEIGLIENLQREDLNVVEQARGYKALIEDFLLTQEEVAGRVGKSRPAIANTMRILALPEEILDMVVDGSLTSGHARALLPLIDKRTKAELIAEAKKIVEKGLTVRDVENMVKMPRKLKKKPRKEDIYISEIEKGVSDAWGRKTKIKMSQTKKGVMKGTLTLDFYSNEDLENLITDLLKRGE